MGGGGWGVGGGGRVLCGISSLKAVGFSKAERLGAEISVFLEPFKANKIVRKSLFSRR